MPYLTQDAIGRTLDYMSLFQNSEVVFDYMESPEAFSEELRQLETKRTEQLKKLDERSVSRFEPAGIAAILRSHGFCAIEDINFRETASREMEIVRIKGALQKAEELSDDVAVAIERASLISWKR